MNISCVICGDIFIGLSVNESIYATQCGHLFHYTCLIEWFERAKTCPQCRHKSSEKNIIRIFFNNSNLSGDTDSSLLKHRVDGLEFQLKMNEMEIKKLKEAKTTAEGQNEGLRKEMKSMKLKTIASEQTAHTLRDEVKALKGYCKKHSEVKLENEELKQKITALNSVKMILDGSVEETECVVDNTDLEAQYLRHCVKEFKQRIKKLEFEHKMTEKELLFYKRKLAFQNKQLHDTEEKLESMKRSRNFEAMGSNQSNNSILEISSEKDSSVISVDEPNETNKKNSIGGIGAHPENRALSYLQESSTKNLRISKPVPFYKPKSSLLGVTKPKLQIGRIPKVSLSVANGDDIFHPTKYPNKKIKIVNKHIRNIIKEPDTPASVLDKKTFRKISELYKKQ